MSNIFRIKSDKIILGDAVFDGYIYFSNGKITDITKDTLPFDTEYDKTGFFVSAGFIDIHTHGGSGCEFFGSAEDVVEACNFHLSHGTASICPTLSAAPFEIMKKSVYEIRKAKESPNLKPNIIGLHLEGPYLSKEQCGGQCCGFITLPIKTEYESLISEAKDVIARWTYAPENDENGVFCKFLTENGIVASAGHTNARFEDIKTAFKNGCKLITHLYSCTSTITRENGYRKLGVIESAYLMDDMFVEIIADGKHLPPDLIKLILKIKGSDHVALVSDSLAITGTTAVSGTTLGTDFIIEDGVCKLADRSAFAGSMATSDLLVKTLINDVGISVCETVKMITKVPAKIMGLDNKGVLAIGKDADFTVFDDSVNIKSVFVNGEEKFKR